MQSLLPKMRLMRRISFLSRPVSGTLLSRPVQLGLSKCHLSSSIILHKEPPKGFGNFGSKTPDKGSKKSRRTRRKETATETGTYQLSLLGTLKLTTHVTGEYLTGKWCGNCSIANFGLLRHCYVISSIAVACSKTAINRTLEYLGWIT